MKVIRIRHERNSYYFEYFDSDTIKDIMNLLYKKHNIGDDKQLSIHQGPNKLDLNQKIKDLEHKNDLYINGNIEYKKNSSNDQEKNNQKNEEEDYLTKFHEMGFNDCDDKINQLLQKNYVFEDIIIILLKNKKIVRSNK